MTTKPANQQYVAFLRGINVGGHHKVPMADLREELSKLKLEDVETLLNSGNIIFKSEILEAKELEKIISKALDKKFGFPFPTLVRTADLIRDLLILKPFDKIKLTKDIRLYVSFLKEDKKSSIELPWKSDDNSIQIFDKKNDVVLSVLDVSISQTPNAMEILEKSFGKEITTRNWNTIERIGQKLIHR